ncbi:MAG: sulfate permease [Bacteroidota bacterium]
MLKPKLFTTLKNYTREQFIKDSFAGIVVGIVALPLSIAFAIASGVSPEKGLITAVVGGFLISALGGSRVAIGGPTGAFVVIIYGIVQQYGLNGLMIATIMAGIILIILGVSGFGSTIKFIPHPIIVGFTSGIAVIIFSSQIKDFFGLQMGNVPSEFFDKWKEFALNFSNFNFYALAISSASLLIIIFLQKFYHKIPAPIFVIIISTFVVQYFQLPVETIGSRFGKISSMIPSPTMPLFDFEIIKNLLRPATTIAILAGIESLLACVVADGMIGSKHRSNMELVAQGVANIASPLFGGIPATTAIVRTATNIRSGGRTPIAGIIHSITLLLIMLLFGRWASLIPLSTLAAILVIVAYNMSEWKTFLSLMRSPRSDVIVLITTFFLTVVVDLVVAIEIGMVLAVFLFMKRMSEVTNIGIVTRELKDGEEVEDSNATENNLIPKGVEVFEINGPFFFGAVEKFKEVMNYVEDLPKVRIIRMRNVNAIDATGLHTIREVFHSSKKQGCQIILSEVHSQPVFAFTKSGIFDEIGEANFHGNFDDALTRAKEVLSLGKIK